MPYWNFRRSIAGIARIVGYGEQIGLNPSALLRRSGVQANQLTNHQLEISASQELQVVQNLLAQTNRAGVGLEVGEGYHLSSFGLWGYGLISSETLRDAIRLALKLINLTSAFTLISFHETPHHGVLTFGEPELQADINRFLVERDVGAARVIIGELTGQIEIVEEVNLRGAPCPANFPIQFNSSQNLLLVNKQALDAKLPQANPVTVAMCEQLCAELIERRKRTETVSQRVRQYLHVPGMGCPDLATMASMLHLSERTFRRRLSEEGTSYREITSEERINLATDLLSNPKMSLSVIAEHLGFSDLSSFSQAFKRWTGQSASEYRKTAKPVIHDNNSGLDSHTESVKTEAKQTQSK